jgi:hypothetical protein
MHEGIACVRGSGLRCEAGVFRAALQSRFRVPIDTSLMETWQPRRLPEACECRYICRESLRIRAVCLDMALNWQIWD